MPETGSDRLCAGRTQRREQRKVLEPIPVLMRVLVVMAPVFPGGMHAKAFERLAQPRPGIAHVAEVAAAVSLGQLTVRRQIRGVQQTAFRQRFEADEQRVAGVRGRAVVRRVARSERTDRQHLPPGLPRALQEVREAVCRRTQITKPVKARQGRDMQQSSARTPKHRLPSDA
jgi:hypothetical protein